MTSPSAPPVKRRSRRRWLLGALGVLILLVALGVAALSMLSVPSEAQAAREDLTTALSALRSEDPAAAEESVASARRHIESAQDGLDGLGGDVWAALPFLGTPVEDARHLVQALDEGASVAEIGVDLYPSVAGRKATLFRNEQVDEKTLHQVIAGAENAGDHLAAAREELDAIRASTPLIGARIASYRDQAEAQVDPAADTFAAVQPVLDELPTLFGFEGRTSYLIAMLNPAELRYSGGAALTYAEMAWDAGRLDVGEGISPARDPRIHGRFLWRKVVGNNFHRGRNRIANSTFAPSWSTSGAELIRAWSRSGVSQPEGVIAVDVVTLARLLSVTGPLTVTGFGEVTGDSLVETLVGSYDDYYPDATAQDEFNDALIPAFKTALFDGGGFFEKGRILGEAADGRHFATYFRDTSLQDGFAAVGLSGELADTPGDYLFVGTQNTNGSKVDFYQRRSLDLDVQLDTDGTATNRLDVTIDNDTPPYVDPLGVDPRSGYFTRWAGMALSVFVPDGAEVEDVTLQGKALEVQVRGHYQHDFLAEPLTLEPGGTGDLSVAYRVPGAASMTDSGELVYRLAIDPQGTVHPASVRIAVRVPDGYAADVLPEGWTQRGNTLAFRTDALTSSEEWAIPLTADN